jgi:hypothetical protein
MAIAGSAAARLSLTAVPFTDAADATPASALHRDLTIAFTETPGRFVCEVPAAEAEHFADQLNQRNGLNWAWIGDVVSGDQLEILSTAGSVTKLPVGILARAWRGET